MFLYFFFFFKQKTAYEMRISDWSSDVCSSDLFVLETSRCQRCLHSLRRALMRIRSRFDGDIADRRRHADLLPAETLPSGLASFAAIVTQFAFDVVVARPSVYGRVRRARYGDFTHGWEFAAAGPALHQKEGA